MTRWPAASQHHTSRIGRLFAARWNSPLYMGISLLAKALHRFCPWPVSEAVGFPSCCGHRSLDRRCGAPPPALEAIASLETDFPAVRAPQKLCSSAPLAAKVCRTAASALQARAPGPEGPLRLRLEACLDLELLIAKLAVGIDSSNGNLLLRCKENHPLCTKRRLLPDRAYYAAHADHASGSWISAR